jgi:rhamnose transport system substrate-binding protein
LAATASAVGLVTLSLAACGSSDPGASASSSVCTSGDGTIGYVPKLGTDPYMVTVRKAAEAAASKAGGKVVYTSPSSATGSAQIPFINQLIAQHVCVIAISGSDLNASAAALRRAKAAGIKVESWDSDIAPASRQIFINQAPSEQLGQKMLDSMSDLLGPGGGQIAILSTTPTAVNQNQWIATIKSQIATNPKYKNLSVVKVAYGQEQADVNAQQTKALVQAYPHLKGIIVPAGIGYPAAAQALDQLGLLGKIKMTGLAPSSLIKNYIATGNAQDVWWNVGNLGTLSYYAAQALAEGKISGKAGETFTAGDLGTFKVGANGEVLLGNAETVTAKNVDEFPF